MLYDQYIHEGSPLHPQGTHPPTQHLETSDRITPASAGNTFYYEWKIGQTEDHPCIRREHAVDKCQDDNLKGSPLHPQGTRTSYYVYRQRLRITPASAGNTLLVIRLVQ